MKVGKSMPFIRFSDLVHKITVKLQNQQYSVLAKSDVYENSNLNDYQFAHPKRLYQGPRSGIIMFSYQLRL